MCVHVVRACRRADEGSGRRRNALMVLPLTLSSQSTAVNTRTTIQSYLLKRRKGVMGPPVGKVSGPLRSRHRCSAARGRP